MSNPLIALCACSQKHTVFGLAFPHTVTPEDAAAAVATILDRMLQAGVLHPWCAMCGEPREQWQIQAGESLFDWPQTVRELSRAQAAEREYHRRMREAGLTFDPPEVGRERCN